MGCYVLGFQEIDRTQVAAVGGKGAHLGELSRIEGICVPAGFCVTTDVFQRIMAEAPSIDDRLDRLSRLKPDDREAIRALSALSAEIRRTIEGIAIPDDLTTAVTRALARLGEQAAYAVRSSATAEDLPTASFAGQQDTYLNVVGPAAVLQHVSRCWASLFTERAVTYRLRNGFDHRKVQMAVVVQQMVFPHAAGVLLTADPITSSRKVASVEASFGLGEALVSGLVNADIYKVRDGDIVAKAVATKQLAIHALPAGGTQEQAIEPERQEQPALTDAQVVQLAQLGRRIEAHFGRPQDIDQAPLDVLGAADHHAVPHPGGRRPSQPRLRLGRSSADDDRPHEAPGALPVAADGPPADVRGRREALRRRHPGPGVASEPRRPRTSAGGPSAATGRAPGASWGRSSSADDRPHEAPGALPVAADGPPADVRGRRKALRRRHPGPGVASEPHRPPRGPGEVRSADRRRAADHPRTRRLHPVAPGRGSRRAGPWRRASPNRDRSGHRHRADRAQPGFHRRLEARHPDEVRIGAARLHPGGHPGAEADPVRSAKPSGVHGGDGGHLVA